MVADEHEISDFFVRTYNYKVSIYEVNCSGRGQKYLKSSKIIFMYTFLKATGNMFVDTLILFYI